MKKIICVEINSGEHLCYDDKIDETCRFCLAQFTGGGYCSLFRRRLYNQEGSIRLRRCVQCIDGGYGTGDAPLK
jgi:hypothetical protein